VAGGSPAANGEMNLELAERRCKRWQEDAPFNKGDFFAQRLAQAAISAEELKQMLAGIEALAQEFPQAPFDRNTIDALLFARLPGRLLRMISRTLVLEMNVARVQGQLAGETPEARFENFVERLRDLEIALAILQEYPVLARQLVVTIDNWVAVGLEFLRHLCEDWPAIRATFSVDAPAVLKALKGDVGDSHRGGRAVIIAEFDSGFKIVYKPRSMAVEGHFQELLLRATSYYGILIKAKASNADCVCKMTRIKRILTDFLSV